MFSVRTFVYFFAGLVAVAGMVTEPNTCMNFVRDGQQNV